MRRLLLASIIGLFVLGFASLVDVRRESITSPSILSRARSHDSADDLVRGLRLDQPQGGGFLGVVMAQESVDLAPEVGGRLESVNVRLGDHVARDAKIATLELGTIPEELSMAQATLRLARSEQQKAELELIRARKRHSRRVELANVFSHEEIEASELEEKLAVVTLESAQSRVMQEMAHVSQIEKELAQKDIRAPFEGIVAARYQDAGAMLSPGTRIVRLIRSGDLWVRFAISKEKASLVTIGTAIIARIEGRDVPVCGMVRHIAPEIDPASETVTVEATLEIPDRWRDRIQPGLVARISLSDSWAPHNATCPNAKQDR